ncbi:clathrin adaptor complex small chain-domain-containing protein [Lipomyces oligophaga]|uniref:clathrin adaptor complex small chain-domain-containing protein n=1 Tax=Lipomyces oligophaga TaxID=45792 RepID=UPI0034CDCB33
MINAVMIFNNFGVPRLAKFYTPLDLQTQQVLISQLFQLLSTRPSTQCNFLTPPPMLSSELDDIRVIYRHYATLYFVFVVDEQESELGILDLIQVFVESLDRCFDNVCELDLVFGWEVLHVVLNEIIQGGMVVETNINEISAAVDEIGKLHGNKKGSIASSTLSLSSTSTTLTSIARETRAAWSNR